MCWPSERTPEAASEGRDHRGRDGQAARGAPCEALILEMVAVELRGLAQIPGRRAAECAVGLAADQRGEDVSVQFAGFLTEQVADGDEPGAVRDLAGGLVLHLCPRLADGDI